MPILLATPAILYLCPDGRFVETFIRKKCVDGDLSPSFHFCRNFHSNRYPSDLPHLILLDVKLPRIDGFEVLRQIRADQKTSLIPVVILTSSNDEWDIIRGYEGGADFYIRKPVDFEQLVKFVREFGLFWMRLRE